MRETRDSLLQECPKPISPVAYALCDRAAILAAHLAEADRAALAGEGRPGRDYLAMQNAYNRVLRQLAMLRPSRSTSGGGDSLVARLAAAAAERAA